MSIMTRIETLKWLGVIICNTIKYIVSCKAMDIKNSLPGVIISDFCYQVFVRLANRFTQW